MPNYIFGGDTGMTLAQIQMKRAKALRMAGKVGAPRNVGEGLSAIGAALGSRMAEGRAARGEKAGRASAATAFAPIAEVLSKFGDRSPASAPAGTTAPSSPAPAPPAAMSGGSGSSAMMGGASGDTMSAAPAANVTRGDDRSATGTASDTGVKVGQRGPMQIARELIGKGERPDNAVISEYLARGGQNLDPATTAWCAAYVNSTLNQSGSKGTGRLNARSFMDWGEATDNPQVGDVAVFSRGDPNGWEGHVGFYQGTNPDGTINVLGGNQGNAVNVKAYSADRLLGYRRDNGQGPGGGTSMAAQRGPVGANAAPPAHTSGNPGAALVAALQAPTAQPIADAGGQAAVIGQQGGDTLANTAPPQNPALAPQSYTPTLPQQAPRQGAPIPQAAASPFASVPMEALMAAANNEFLPQGQRAIVNMALKDRFAQADPLSQLKMQKMALEVEALRNPQMTPFQRAQVQEGAAELNEKIRQFEVERGTVSATDQATNDLERAKQAETARQFNVEQAAPVTVGGNLVNPQTGKPIYQSPTTIAPNQTRLGSDGKPTFAAPAAPQIMQPGSTYFDPNTRQQFTAPTDPSANLPAVVREYQHYAQAQRAAGRQPLGPLEYQQELKKAGASRTSVNVSNAAGRPLPKLPAGYAYRYNQDGTPMLDDRGVPIAAAITGTEAARKAERADIASDKAATNRAKQAGLVLEDIRRAKEMIEGQTVLSPVTGNTGQLTADWLRGSDAADARALVETVKSNIGFDRLQQMRESSPTGGALGNVTEMELRTLQAVLGSLEFSQSAEQLNENLSRLDQIYTGIVNKAAATGDGTFQPVTASSTNGASPSGIPNSATPPEGVDRMTWLMQTQRERREAVEAAPASRVRTFNPATGRLE